MIAAVAASFPPDAGGLSPAEVDEIRGALDDTRMARGAIGGAGERGTNTAVRSGHVQWLTRRDLSPAIFSHLYTLACVTNRERGWNFAISGPAPALQATSYAADGNEHYDWHLDWGPGRLRNRKISVVAHLSDPGDFDGGTLQLTIGSIPVDAVPGAGTVTVFPSFVLHRVTPVTRGRRLGAVSWVLGSPFT